MYSAIERNYIVTIYTNSLSIMSLLSYDSTMHAIRLVHTAKAPGIKI